MCLNTFQNTLKILFRRTKNICTKANFGNPKTLQDIAFRVVLKFGKKVKINEVPDTAFLFQAAALFSVICYPLRGTNVFKIPILVVKSI